jgi:hypothetical protein
MNYTTNTKNQKGGTIHTTDTQFQNPVHICMIYDNILINGQLVKTINKLVKANTQNDFLTTMYEKFFNFEYNGDQIDFSLKIDNNYLTAFRVEIRSARKLFDASTIDRVQNYTNRIITAITSDKQFLNSFNQLYAFNKFKNNM